MQSDSTLSEAYPQVRRCLRAWKGYATLDRVMRTNVDLRVYVAGGVVRNVLMGRPVATKDWDLFLAGDGVSAAIEQFARHGRLEATPYGAPRWFASGSDAEYADLIPVADFVPGLWPCEDIVDVLNQFDFTANAVAFDLRTGEAFDPQNGARDARRAIMKMVRFDYPDGPYIQGAALDRNTVLWLRIVHYVSILQFEVEPLTRRWLIHRGDQRVHAAAFEREFFRPDLRAWETIGG